MDKSLITITTCNRLSEVKKYIWDYIAFCNAHDGFDILLALDGSQSDYLNFCSQFQIPLLYSDEREGVGLSKNRTLKQFPNYDYYFFIEDDVELVESSVFSLLKHLANETGFPHFCHNHPLEIFNRYFVGEYEVTYSKRGGAQCALYTREGLKKVGGWHTKFAKYKRFGHTEHSFRYVHKALQPAPFVYSEAARKKLIIHTPPRVTKQDVATDEAELITDEAELIKNKFSFYELKTLSSFYFNGFSMANNPVVEDFLKNNKQKYPLTSGKERRIALAEHYFLRIRTTSNFLKKYLFFLKTLFYYPLNTPLKHWLKTKVFLYGK